MSTINFDGESFDEVWAGDPNFTTRVGQWRHGWLDGTFDGVNSNGGVASGFAQTYDNTGFVNGYSQAVLDIDWPSDSESTECGAAFINAAGTGFSAFLSVGGNLTVRKEVAGSAGDIIDAVDELEFIGIPQLKVGWNNLTGDYTVSLNDSVLSTGEYSDTTENVYVGFQMYHSGSRSDSNILSVTTTLGDPTAIDSLGESGKIRVGTVVEIETTGLETLTDETTVNGIAVVGVNAPDGDGTITTAGFVDGEISYDPMGTDVECVARDETKAANTTLELDTFEGWQWKDIVDFDADSMPLGAVFTAPDIPTQIHLPNNGVGVLNEDGTLTKWPLGSTTGWARMPEGTWPEGTMKQFTFTASGGGDGSGDDPTVSIRTMSIRKMG